MSRPVLKVGNYKPDEIKALFRDDERYTIGIRLYAVYQVAMGQPSRKLEDLYNTSFKQITNWVHRFEKEGIEGLKDKKGRGRTARLNEDQRKRIGVLLTSEPPTGHGYNSAPRCRKRPRLWSTCKVANAISRWSRARQLLELRCRQLNYIVSAR